MIMADYAKHMLMYTIGYTIFVDYKSCDFGM